MSSSSYIPELFLPSGTALNLYDHCLVLVLFNLMDADEEKSMLNYPDTQILLNSYWYSFNTVLYNIQLQGQLLAVQL